MKFIKIVFNYITPQLILVEYRYLKMKSLNKFFSLILIVLWYRETLLSIYNFKYK